MSVRARRLGVLSVAGLVAVACGATRAGHPSEGPPAPTPRATCAAAPRPAVPPLGRDPDPDPDADTITAKEEPSSDDASARACEVSVKTLAEATAAVLALPAPPSRSAVKAGGARQRGLPLYLDLAKRRFALTDQELVQLSRDGVVVPSRLEVGDWAESLHEVWQSQLPLWVSADAILHAVYASNDRLAGRVEEERLAPRIDKALGAMHCALLAVAAGWPKDVAHDTDLYLTVARSLLAGAPVPSVTGADAEARALVLRLEMAEGIGSVDIFGRSRRVDFSQYRPRGRYADHPVLTPYFRAGMFLSRFELNLVSRSSRSSATRTCRIRGRRRARSWSRSPSPSSRREPMSMGTSRRSIGRGACLRASARMSASTISRLSARERASPRSRPPMPPIDFAAPSGTTSAGPRASIPCRKGRRSCPRSPRCSERGSLRTRLPPDRWCTERSPAGTWSDRWTSRTSSVTTGRRRTSPRSSPPSPLSTRSSERREPSLRRRPPPRISTAAGSRRCGRCRHRQPPPRPPSCAPPRSPISRIAGALAAYAQLRHNNVLVVGQGYDEGGCEIPDAYVDPVPRVFEELATYARRGVALAEIADPDGKLRLASYFERLARTLDVLARIARWELSGQPLPAEMTRWLGLVVELRPYGGTGGPPSFTGWWFDLFRLRQEGLSSAALVSDTFTSSEEEKVLYLGVRAPRLGLFVVDAGGPPRVMVGPVPRAYSAVSSLSRRISDAEASRLAAEAPWEASYTSVAPPAPPLEVRGTYPYAYADAPPKTIAFELRSTKALGQVTVEALDYHRVPSGAQTHAVGLGWAKFTLPYASEMDGIRIRAGGAILELRREHQSWQDESPMPMHAAFGALAVPR